MKKFRTTFCIRWNSPPCPPWFAVLLPFLFITLSSTAQNHTNKFGMEFVLIQPGTFTCGKFQPPYPIPPVNPPDETSEERGYNSTEYKLAETLAKKDALPGFLVTIQQALYIGKYEITQAQWQKIMGSNPSMFQGNKIPDDAGRHPVESISWKDAQLFLQKLNSLDTQNIYRLPTEFEWEYAARAGRTDDIPWASIRNEAQLGTRTTQPVGVKKPNAWGLYDMLGNVWEWTQDLYNEKIFADAVPALAGKEHVLKGASFTGDVKNATYMTHAAGPGNGWDVGFRVVMEKEQKN